MEVALSRDCDGPEFARVTKRLRDANGIPIGTNDNPILDMRMYEESTWMATKHLCRLMLLLKSYLPAIDSCCWKPQLTIGSMASS